MLYRAARQSSFAPVAWFLYPGWEKYAWCFAGNFTGGRGGLLQWAPRPPGGDQRAERLTAGAVAPNGAPSRLPACRCAPPYIRDGASASDALQVCRGKGGGGTDPHSPQAVHTLYFEGSGSPLELQTNLFAKGFIVFLCPRTGPRAGALRPLCPTWSTLPQLPDGVILATHSPNVAGGAVAPVTRLQISG